MDWDGVQGQPYKAYVVERLMSTLGLILDYEYNGSHYTMDLQIQTRALS